jgi:hypothetical protein
MQQGFRLIIGMMGKNDPALWHCRLQSRMPCFARCILETTPGNLHMHTLDTQRQLEPVTNPRTVPHPGVGIRVQSVMHVNGVQSPSCRHSKLCQQIQ